MTTQSVSIQIMQALLNDLRGAGKDAAMADFDIAPALSDWASRLETAIATLQAADATCDGQDAVRLDWLMSRDNRSIRVQGNGNNWSVLDCSNGLTFITRDQPSARAAIDAAIALSL